MHTTSDLRELVRELRDTRVLSVYIDGSGGDPADLGVWRRRLGHELERLRGELDAGDRSGREGFERATTLLEAHLAAFPGSIGAPGWVGFVLPQGVHYAERLPVRVKTAAWWSDGPRIAPYAAVLAQRRQAIVAVVDANEAHVYRHRSGELELLDHLRADLDVEVARHLGRPARPAFHSGTRGAVGTDEAARALGDRRRQMMRLLAERLVAAVTEEDCILIGGTPAAAREALASLPDHLARPALHMASLDVHARESEIRGAAEAGATVVRQAAEQALADETIARYDADGLAVIGWQRTARALEERSIETLLLTRRFVDAVCDDAEAAVRSAIEHGARVEVLAGAAADRLDAEGEGIGARLRFSPYRTPGVPESAAGVRNAS